MTPEQQLAVALNGLVQQTIACAQLAAQVAGLEPGKDYIVRDGDLVEATDPSSRDH